MMPLRPHHLLCMQFFAGQGYSDDFVRNMMSVLDQLQTEPAHLTTSADVICKACPNLQNGVCCTEKKVQRYDLRVQSLLGLSQDETVSLSQIQQIFQTMDLSTVLSQICPDCQWQALCQSKV